MSRDYSVLRDHDITVLGGPAGEFSLYRSNPERLPVAVHFVVAQVNAALADMGFPELHASVSLEDSGDFEPRWASVEEECSGVLPRTWEYRQEGSLRSREDTGFSARFSYVMRPYLVRAPEDDIEAAVFATGAGPGILTVEKR